MFPNAINKNTSLCNCLASSCLHQQPIKPNWRQSNLAYRVITSASAHSPPSITVSAGQDIHQTTVSIFSGLCTYITETFISCKQGLIWISASNWFAPPFVIYLADRLRKQTCCLLFVACGFLSDSSQWRIVNGWFNSTTINWFRKLQHWYPDCRFNVWTDRFR